MISARKAKHLDVTTMFTYSHANTPLCQSERAYYLSYFINRDDDVCKHVTYKIPFSFILYLCLCKLFNFIHGPGGPGGPGGGDGGGRGGLIPYMADTGMCLWTEHCPSTKSRHTRHKRATNKSYLIWTNRNIYPYIIQIRTPGKFKLSFLDIIKGRHNTVLV